MGRVLAIEDDRTVGLVLEHVLETAGHEVRLARGVADGRGALAEGRYDAILLDLNLPDGSGLDLLREIREEAPSTPVLVLSGMRQEEVVVRGLRLGADDYVTKPFSPRELLARLERWVKR